MIRFWNKVDKNGPIPEHRPDLGPCWTWKAGCSGDGYGAFWFQGKTVRAHRFSLQLHGTHIPEGMLPDHLCRVTKCVNPSHIEVVTPKENVSRAKSPPSDNGKKTHCSSGHPFEGDNLYAQGTRRRVCVACRRRWRMERYYAQPKSLRRFA